MHISLKSFSLICMLTWSIQIATSQHLLSQNLQQNIQRYQQDSLIQPAQLEQLENLKEWINTQHPNIPSEYTDLLNKYLNYIQRNTYKPYNAMIHEDVIIKSIDILKAASDPTIDMKSWVRSLLPEYYIPVKILVPSSVYEEAVMEMAKERPQELIGQFSRIFYTDYNQDLETAILLSPHLVSQFMHYNNSVKTQLQKSTHSDIKLLFDIYQKYRYSQHPYYLLPYISRKDLTIEQAEEYSKNEVTLISYLLPLVRDSVELAAISVQQRWEEINNKYIKKIKTYQFRNPSVWDMESFQQLSMPMLTQILFFTNNQLNPSELNAFMNWLFFKNKEVSLAKSNLDSVPLKELLSLHNRIQHDQLQDTWLKLWGLDTLSQYLAQRKKAAEPVELANILQSVNYSKPSASIGDKLPPIKTSQPEFVIKKYFFNLPDDEKKLIKWKNDPMTALENIATWIDAPYSKELLFHIAEQYPLEVIKNLDKIKLKKQGIEALKHVGYAAPLTTKNFIIQPTHPWNHLFMNSQDSVIKILYKIHQEAGINSRAYLLLDDIYHHRLTIGAADSLCKDSQRLTKRMIELLAKPNVLGKYSIEQEISFRALKFVRHLNISENTDNYFSENLQSLTSEELYTFLTYGEDEIIQKGFYKMLKTLLNKTPQGNLYPLMEKLGFNNYKKFLRKCAYYDLLDTVFNSFSPQQKDKMVQMLLDKMEMSSEADAIQVADIIISLNSPSITELIHERLKDEYERAENAKLDKGVAIYGILSSLLSKKLEYGWAKYVAQKYELPGLDLLPAYSLFNQQMVNIQQYYFYNDDDGVGSYNNFIKSYERSPLEWLIKDLGSFVMIQSKTGRKIEVYANKAREGEKGISDMLDYMKKNNLEPQIVVHRGLSTHTLKTFTRIPSSAKLILDGSCGGYHVQQVAIDRAPGAQILCNRNVGTMHINDPMFKQINDDIRAGKDISWPDFWDKMNKRVGTNPYFKDYIPPHKNAATILIKALYDILEIN